MQFPEHKASLHLTHNQHKAYYETVEQYLSNYDDVEDMWINEEQKQKSLETQELWELQWYPLTPIGFIKLMAADLEPLLEEALKTK